jgi:hypothetical protein
MSSDGKPDLTNRNIQALKKTWDELNPGGHNPFIVPDTATMLWIDIYGGDDEAARAYRALSEQEQITLVCEVFPAYYPKGSHDG